MSGRAGEALSERVEGSKYNVGRFPSTIDNSRPYCSTYSNVETRHKPLSFPRTNVVCVVEFFCLGGGTGRGDKEVMPPKHCTHAKDNGTSAQRAPAWPMTDNQGKTMNEFPPPPSSTHTRNPRAIRL